MRSFEVLPESIGNFSSLTSLEKCSTVQYSSCLHCSLSILKCITSLTKLNLRCSKSRVMPASVTQLLWVEALDVPLCSSVEMFSFRREQLPRLRIITTMSNGSQYCINAGTPNSPKTAEMIAHGRFLGIESEGRTRLCDHLRGWVMDAHYDSCTLALL